ncbi:MFS general substrate transporter [Ceraceosorus guamensis]|uniref:MFS general substrate transporter n=1 Tax=Ceraceosorus guamensis TaxID=1522189 RepID=A0A316WA08_9BASI|nr:MFS general substrate transporter [Ceraceosorus guamensis]PWN45571.1 MFS general substrate transporter [Ceraceosorus guamensis]
MPTPQSSCWSEQEERRLKWKIDAQVLPLTLLLYTLSFLDRTNIGQARLIGLQEQLSLSFHDYQVALTVLYAPYIAFEIPSNLLIKKIGPARLIPFLVTAWGIVSTLQGIVTTRTGLFINRAFLGFAETGILPGLALYLTFFYKASEIQLRQAIYFSGASLAGAFNGVLSTAINLLSGRAGLLGWSWLFILEGIFTVLVGIACFWILPNDASKLWWCSEREKQIAEERVEQSRFTMRVTKDVQKSNETLNAPPRARTAGEPFSWSEVGRAFTDPLVLLVWVAGLCDASGVYGLAFFAPTIIKGLPLGLTTVQAQLLSSPPFAAAFVTSIILALVSDRLRWRYLTGLIGFLLAIVGLAMAYASTNAKVQYGGLIVMSMGLYTLPSSLITWVLSSTGGYYKRATAIALLIVGTNSGGIVGTWLFDPTEAPRFRRGFITLLVLQCVGLLSISILEAYLLWERRTRKQRHADWISDLKAQGCSEASIRQVLGDRHPDFVREL